MYIPTEILCNDESGYLGVVNYSSHTVPFTPAAHGRVAARGGTIVHIIDTRTKPSSASWFLASYMIVVLITKQLNQSNLIIFHAYNV